MEDSFLLRFWIFKALQLATGHVIVFVATNSKKESMGIPRDTINQAIDFGFPGPYTAPNHDRHGLVYWI